MNMRTLIIGFLAAIVVAACSSVLTPQLDRSTGTTLAQRCVDYRASLAALEATGKTGGAEYVVLSTWVTANCPPIEPVQPGIIVE